MTKKEAIQLRASIAKRAEGMKILLFDRQSLMMDLEAATETFNLKLRELLDSKESDFIHDVIGIQNNINRQTKIFGNFFLPRFSAVREDEK